MQSGAWPGREWPICCRALPVEAAQHSRDSEGDRLLRVALIERCALFNRFAALARLRAIREAAAVHHARATGAGGVEGAAPRGRRGGPAVQYVLRRYELKRDAVDAVA